MARVSGPLKSSVNAGEFARQLLGRVNVKQYYSAAKRMLGFEPQALSGFLLAPGSRHIGVVPNGVCRKGILNVDTELSYTLVFTSGRVDIWRSDGVKVVTNLAIPEATPARLPDFEFYGEANTFGIFHTDLTTGKRLTRNPSNDTIWALDDWPLENIPEEDLGGTYTKTDDEWQFHIRWTVDTPAIVVVVTVDGQSTNAVTLLHAGNPVKPEDATFAEWIDFRDAVGVAVQALPGFSAGVSMSEGSGVINNTRTFRITFGGPLSGAEYQFDMQVTNTSDASALSTHAKVGKTEGEPLVSATRGGFAGMTLYQDRAVYWGPKAKSAALAMSRTGEYFDLNKESQADSGARLEALRSSTGEAILHVVDATYLLIFTERAEYFASNRTIKRNEPLNFVRASGIGSRRGCRPAVLEGYVYFISKDGGRLYRTSYDAVSEAFAPEPVNDFNGDLVSGIVRMEVQRKSGAMTSDRLWLLREDGRLVLGKPNVAQEILLSACEWQVNGGGFVRGIAVDGNDKLWITVERNGQTFEEIVEEEDVNFLQGAYHLTTDLTGQASGLAALEGKSVWALIDGDALGPFTVSSGAIGTDEPSRPAVIGLWSRPIFESMPYVRVLPNDDVVRRPGKVSSAKFYIIDTTSIAIGANGLPAKDCDLNLASDDLLAPRVGLTGHLSVIGLKGACMDPTITITQARPGWLNVRDFIPGLKL